MANTAIQIQYRKEFIAGFEQGQSLLRMCCTNESVIQGQQAVFLTVDSGGAQAVTRGVNGLIPPRADNLNQFTATLQEWHDKPRRTGFNIFESQGDGRRAMQMTTVKVVNRKIDSDIIGSLANTTTVLNGGVGQVASLALVMQAAAKLANNAVDVDEEDNLFFLISPAFWAYLSQIKEFNSADWVDVKPAVGAQLGINGRRMLRWQGFNFIKHPNLTGKQTNAEQCYAFHRSAIGHAVNVGDMKVDADYNREDDYYWARTSIYMGSALLQNKGIVKVVHDGSAFA